ncbi:MinD/ParA family protein [Halobaculum halobium]|uniref:MinD/ParA family ATP-binding protein n=1 Tax=Halobaculum halobium TaxID=3032281 RepID=UPI0036184A8A
MLEAITGADYVIVDTGAGLTHQTALPLSVADGVLLVSTPTRDGLANTRKTQDLTEKLGGEVVGLALNEAAGDEDTGAVDVPVLGAIPDDPLVAEAQAAGSPSRRTRPTATPRRPTVRSRLRSPDSRSVPR